MKSNITLYCQGDGVTAESHTILYKNIKEFKVNANGTVTFKTLKHGTITTPLLWRLAENLPDEEGGEPAVAGNQARVRRGY